MPPASVKLEELSQYFNLPEKAVAQKMGMCLTSLKKVCRENGIMRWPFRKLKSLERTMKKVNADSNSISAQIGRSKTHAAHGSADGSSSSREGSRPPTPPAPLFPSQVAKASEVSDAPGHPAFQCAEVAAQRLDRSNSDCETDFPSFSVSGMHMQQLIITNWSSMWTVYHLKKHIVEQLGGSGMLISEDGSNAYLDFTSSLAAQRAQRVCEEACRLVRSRQGGMHPTPRICPDLRSRLLDAHCVLLRPETQAAASCSHEHYSTSSSSGFQCAHAHTMHAIHAPNFFEVRNGRIASAEEVYHIMPLSSSASPNSGPPASGNILDLDAAGGSQRALSGSVGSGVGSPPVLSISKCNPTSPHSGGSWSSSDLDWMTPCLVAC